MNNVAPFRVFRWPYELRFPNTLTGADCLIFAHLKPVVLGIRLFGNNQILTRARAILH